MIKTRTNFEYPYNLLPNQREKHKQENVQLDMSKKILKIQHPKNTKWFHKSSGNYVECNMEYNQMQCY